MKKVELRFSWAAILVCLLMIFVAVLPYVTNRSTHETMVRLWSSQQETRLFEDLADRLTEAETGQRGYIITGKESFLDSFYLASSQLPAIKHQLTELAQRSPAQKSDIEWILQLTDLKFTELSDTIRMRRDKGFAVVEPVVTSERGKQYMDELRVLIDAHTQRTLREQSDLRSALDAKLENTFWLGLVATVANIAVLGTLLLMMMRALRERGRSTALLRRTTYELSLSMDKATLHNEQMTLTAEMLQALGSLTSMDETSKVISTYCAKLLPGTSGALFLYPRSRDMLERQASWGARVITADLFEPKACWALQRGGFHISKGPNDLRCGHYCDEPESDIVRLCAPLISQGEVIGILFVEDLAKDDAALEVQKLTIERFAEQVALALVNVQLRETLHRQSVTDPLTGLFNRRYMDETLKRELYRAQRKLLPLAVLMLDLDRFKCINDRHGHDAGDAVLRAVALQIRERIRESDLACRYGGEEIVIVMTECNLASAFERAEALRNAIADLNINHAGLTLGITASLGVAVYPEHGSDAETLLHAADQALYEAKDQGRNRVMTAEITETQDPARV
jgi:diguanylate cyclase (GGDEF)-like protein